MIKDTNIRDKVTLTREQSAELSKLGKEHNMSKSQIIGLAVSALLSYKAGEALGQWLYSAIFDENKNSDDK